MWEQLRKEAGSWVADDKGMINPDKSAKIADDDEQDINGDFQADLTGDWLEKINAVYLDGYGRKARISELCKIFMFVVNGEIRMRDLKGEVKCEYTGDEDSDRKEAHKVDPKRTEIINLHPEKTITIVEYEEGNGRMQSFEREAIPLRIVGGLKEVGSSGEDQPYDVKIYEVIGGQLEKISELPKKVDNVYYIVSYDVAVAYPDRDDFIFPIRPVVDNASRVIGYMGFARLKKGEK